MTCKWLPAALYRHVECSNQHRSDFKILAVTVVGVKKILPAHCGRHRIIWLLSLKSKRKMVIDDVQQFIQLTSVAFQEYVDPSVR